MTDEATDETTEAAATTPGGDEIDPTLPEPVRRFLAAGASLESIRLDKLGLWWHEDRPFENNKIIKLFSRSVDRTEGGTWVLNVGRFTYPIEVEDTGFFVDAVEFEGSDEAPEAVTLKLSDGTTEQLDPETLELEGEMGLTCRIKGGDFRARFKKPAYYALTEQIDTSDGHYVLALADDEHKLGRAEEVGG